MCMCNERDGGGGKLGWEESKVYMTCGPELGLGSVSI